MSADASAPAADSPIAAAFSAVIASVAVCVATSSAPPPGRSPHAASRATASATPIPRILASRRLYRIRRTLNRLDVIRARKLACSPACGYRRDLVRLGDVVHSLPHVPSPSCAGTNRIFSARVDLYAPYTAGSNPAVGTAGIGDRLAPTCAWAPRFSLERRSEHRAHALPRAVHPRTGNHRLLPPARTLPRACVRLRRSRGAFELPRARVPRRPTPCRPTICLPIRRTSAPDLPSPHLHPSLRGEARASLLNRFTNSRREHTASGMLAAHTRSWGGVPARHHSRSAAARSPRAYSRRSSSPVSSNRLAAMAISPASSAR